jgi:hypothetical protein
MAQIHTILERSPKRAIAGLNFRLRQDDGLISEVADVLVGWASQTTGALDTERARLAYKSVDPYVVTYDPGSTRS